MEKPGLLKRPGFEVNCYKAFAGVNDTPRLSATRVDRTSLHLQLDRMLLGMHDCLSVFEITSFNSGSKKA